MGCASAVSGMKGLCVIALNRCWRRRPDGARRVMRVEVAIECKRASDLYPELSLQVLENVYCHMLPMSGTRFRSSLRILSRQMRPRCNLFSISIKMSLTDLYYSFNLKVLCCSSGWKGIHTRWKTRRSASGESLLRSRRPRLACACAKCSVPHIRPPPSRFWRVGFQYRSSASQTGFHQYCAVDSMTTSSTGEFVCPRFLRIPRPATILRCAIWSFFSSTSSPRWPGCSDPAASLP
jgi:hypothetical protein